MIENFKVLSFSYRKIPVELREVLSLTESQTRMLLEQIKDTTDLEDVLILSTCNRTEVYYSSPVNRKVEILKLLCWLKPQHKSKLNRLANYAEEIENPTRHLYEVAIGLDSQILGDFQIINQVKKAYQISVEINSAGPFLHRLLHSIFYTNKRITQETIFKDGAVSIAYAAVEQIRRMPGLKTKNPRIISIGLGQLGKDVCKNLKKWFDDITIINRTDKSAFEFAKENGFKTGKFKFVKESILNADIVISSVYTDDFIIDKDSINPGQNLCIIDLSVPRSVNQNIKDIQGITLINIDQIEDQVSHTFYKRKSVIQEVKAIIKDSMKELLTWTMNAKYFPVISKIKKVLDDIRREEIAREIKNMDQKQLESVNEITKGLVQKILKYPVLQLKEACKRNEAESISQILIDMFDLESKHVNDK